MDFENTASELIKRAYLLAREAHEGQYDHSGKPYIMHPMEVASRVGCDELAIAVALLHDVVEDTDVSIDKIKKEFPKKIADAVALMTHSDNESYMDYVRLIKANELARRVKIADISHNIEIIRCNPIRKRDVERIKNKYIPALEYLIDDEFTM